MTGVFRTKRRVEFRDTDTAGIVHFSVYLVMMEEAEHALLRALGLSIFVVEPEGTISWPRVAARCDYRGAARFEDELHVEVRVARLGEKSLTLGFRITRDEAELATGELTAVCCRLRPDHPPESMPHPARFRERLEAFLRGDVAV